MKKTTLFYALAAVAMLPSAANAEMTVYAEAAAAIISSDAGGSRETKLEDQGSLLGVEGEKDLGNGMSAFGTFEIEYDAEGDEIAMAAAFVGLSNGANTFVLGNTDAPSSDVVPKADVFNLFGNAFGQDVGGQDLAAYQFALGENVSGGVAFLFGAMETNDGDADAVDFGIDFALGAATVGLGYTSFDDDADSDLLGIGIELGMGENALIAAHAEDSSADGMTYHLAGQFAAGANTFRVGFAKNDESDEDASTLGFAHEFGEDISMAVEFESSNEADVIGLGLFIAF